MSNCLLYSYQNGQRTGLIEGIESLQWMPEWQSAGEFKLVCSCSEKNRSLLTDWGMLYNPDTPNIAALITYLDKTINKDGRTVIEVRGEFTSCRWKGRAVLGDVDVTDAVSGILSIADANKRGLEVTTGQSSESSPVDYTASWGTCYEAFCDIAEAGDIGFQHTFNPVTAKETLDILTGTDRSDQTTDDYVGYFGTPPQNVASASSILDYSDYGNVGVCNGEAPSEGDTFTQQVVYVGQTSLAGNDRHEIYIDGSGVSHTYQVDDGQGGTTQATYTDAEYTVVLTNYAWAALLKHTNALTIKLEARNTVPIYGTDYEMGDTMPIIIKEIGLRAKAMVTAVKLIYEESGKSMELTFSKFELLD